MLLEHHDRSPHVDGSVYVAPTATVGGDVTIGEESRVLFGAVVALLKRALDLDLDTSLTWEALTQEMMIESADHREGLAAFFEKRPPRFTGA